MPQAADLVELFLIGSNWAVCSFSGKTQDHRHVASNQRRVLAVLFSASRPSPVCLATGGYSG